MLTPNTDPARQTEPGSLLRASLARYRTRKPDKLREMPESPIQSKRLTP